MREPTLREVLGVSLKLTLHHRGLWILGALALVFGQLGIMDMLVAATKAVTGGKPLELTRQIGYLISPEVVGELGGVLQFTGAQWMSLIWLLLIIISIGIVLIIAGSIAQGGIVHSVALSMDHGLKTVEKLSESWHAGTKRVTEIMVLNVLRKCVMFAMAFFVSLGAYIALVYASSGATLFFVVVFLVVSVVGMIVSMLTIYAVGYVVIEGDTLLQSIVRAWRLFRAHWLVSFEVGIVLLLANVAMFVLLAVGIYLLLGPAFGLATYGLLIGSGVLVTAGTVAGSVLLSIYAVVIGSIFTVFVTSTWTYMFIVMHRTGWKSRIASVVRRIIPS